MEFRYGRDNANPETMEFNPRKHSSKYEYLSNKKSGGIVGKSKKRK